MIPRANGIPTPSSERDQPHSSARLLPIGADDCAADHSTGKARHWRAFLLKGKASEFWRPAQPDGSVTPDSESQSHNSTAPYLPANDGNRRWRRACLAD